MQNIKHRVSTDFCATLYVKATLLFYSYRACLIDKVGGNILEYIDHTVLRVSVFIAPHHPPSGSHNTYEGWNFNSGNYLFTTDTK